MKVFLKTNEKASLVGEFLMDDQILQKYLNKGNFPVVVKEKKKYLMYEGNFIMSDKLSWNNDSYLDNTHTFTNYIGVIRNIFILIYRFVRY